MTRTFLQLRDPLLRLAIALISPIVSSSPRSHLHVRVQRGVFPMQVQAVARSAFSDIADKDGAEQQLPAMSLSDSLKVRPKHSSPKPATFLYASLSPSF